jgi:chemotaxis protein methyltransferase CheR
MTYSKNDLMTGEEFALLRDLVHDKFGIIMRGDRRLTLHARISHRLKILGISTYRDYYNYAVSDTSGEELCILASHITNNETYFFREKAQLDLFSGILKDIKRKRQDRNENTLRILSLASSSGEEAYSLNIIVQENGLFAWDWDVKITGMDLNRNAIAKAREASYTKNSFRSLNGDAAMVGKYFTVEGDRYILRRSLTKNVEFMHGNIIDGGSFAGLGPVDAIFCRNVLIYMSDEAIEKVARNFFHVLSDEGYLFIGASESLIQKTSLFVPEYNSGVIVYRKNVRGISLS